MIDLCGVVGCFFFIGSYFESLLERELWGFRSSFFFSFEVFILLEVGNFK